MDHELLFDAAPRTRRLRLVAAVLLRAAGTALDRLARQLVRGDARRVADMPRLEFHAEAGAPEGALYVDGQLVGRLDGVNRL
jgi:hypothetical protein